MKRCPSTACVASTNNPVFAESRWRLHPRVALRPERFGAMVYHYDTRRLSFLKSPDLVRLVEALEHHPSPRAAFDSCGIEARRWPSFQRALSTLADSSMIEPAEDSSSSTPTEASASDNRPTERQTLGTTGR